MSRRARSRAPRVVVAAVICVGVVAAVPALATGTPNSAGAPTGAATSPGSNAPTARQLRAKPTPARANAQAPVARVRKTHAKQTGSKPPRVLAHAEHGTAAIKALGKHLPAVAAKAGWSTTKLRSVLTEDHSAYVSDQGRVYYREDDIPAESTAAPQTAATTVAPAYPTSQTFALHSRPSATRKIFLDFDGASVSSTGWNGTGSGKVANGGHTGFDLDGNPSTFSTAEHGYIQEVWREVSESYAPFDVDVTTQDPGVAGIVRSSTSDTSYGTHVVITSEAAPRTALCGSCLGVAFVGTFNSVDASGYYQPAWVFAYDKTFDPMIVAQAAAHETGHTLGLSHDGTSTSGYSFGTSAWGPIMGGSMNRAVTQWSQGEYADANNHEDDLQVIQNHGLPLRADDYPGTTALGSQASYAVSGVISTRTDTDSFSVSLPCTTTLTVNAKGIGKQTALDLSLTVLNGSGQTVASNSPASTFSGNPPVSAGMNASVSIPNATGTYVLRVDGVGNGNAAGAGWSDYGSLGAYTLTSTGCAATPSPTPAPSVPTPTLAPVGTSVPTPVGSDTPSSAPPSPAPTRPRAPRIGAASPGAKHGAKTATVRWYPPASSSNAPVTSYSVQALRLDKRGRVRASYMKAFSGGLHAVSLRLPAGQYHFRVRAFNRVGGSLWSTYSHTVKAR